jgi:hypothetical protein
MKKIWIIIVGVFLVVAIGGGAFYGGMLYGRSQVSQGFRQFSRGQFGDSGGQLPGAMMTPQAGRGNSAFMSGGVMGTIKSIEGQFLEINTNDGTIRVETTDTTLIEKTMTVGINDLEIDEQVIVMGRQNEDGTITARSIQPLRIPQFGQQPEGQ